MKKIFFRFQKFKIIFLHDKKICFARFFLRWKLHVSTFDSSAFYEQRSNLDTFRKNQILVTCPRVFANHSSLYNHVFLNESQIWDHKFRFFSIFGPILSDLRCFPIVLGIPTPTNMFRKHSQLCTPRESKIWRRGSSKCDPRRPPTLQIPKSSPELPNPNFRYFSIFFDFSQSSAQSFRFWDVFRLFWAFLRRLICLENTISCVQSVHA